MTTDRNTDSGRKVWTRFAVEVSLVILLFMSAIFAGLFASNKRLIEGEIEARARAHFKSIVLTRAWNARYGGVWVEKTPGVESNPYLKNPDIATVDGRIFTKRNPALMTREISELAGKEGDLRFHITSLKPLNPNNTPDAFEAESLRSFEQTNAKEAFRMVDQDGHTYFRYMAPLFVEQSCMACHREQGYEIGQVRGGISVTFKIDDVRRALAQNGVLTFVSFGVALILLLGMIYRFTGRLRLKLWAAEQKIRELAVTDELTGLKNRRHIRERLTSEFSRTKRYQTHMSCILIDIDYFKRINDQYGHTAGDRVLRAFSDMLTSCCRTSDVVGRWGGEEFVILLPESDLSAVNIVAEKLRVAATRLRVHLPDGEVIGCTASFGTASISGDAQLPADPELLVRAADKALYRAKACGRNCVQSEGVIVDDAVSVGENPPA